MPLGPVGFVLGALLGCGVTLSLGLITDSVRIHRKKRQAETQGTRMDHLLRWIGFVFGQYEQQSVQLLLYILQEFEPICAMADHNKTAQTLMKRLRDFLERTEVQNCAAEYWDLFIERWRTAEPDEIATFQTAVQVCTTVFQKQKRWPDIYYRMSQCQNAPIVQDLFAQVAQERKRIKEKAMRDKDWVAFADVGNKRAEDLFRSDFQRKFGLKRWRSASEGRANRSSLTSQTVPVLGADIPHSVDIPPATTGGSISSPVASATHRPGDSTVQVSDEDLETKLPNVDICDIRKHRERHHTVDLPTLNGHGRSSADWLPMAGEKSTALRTSSDTVGLRTFTISGGAPGLFSSSQHPSLRIPEKVPHLFFDRSVPLLSSSEDKGDVISVVDGAEFKEPLRQPPLNDAAAGSGDKKSDSSSHYVSIGGDELSKSGKSVSIISQPDAGDSEIHPTTVKHTEDEDKQRASSTSVALPAAAPESSRAVEAETVVIPAVPASGHVILAINEPSPAPLAVTTSRISEGKSSAVKPSIKGREAVKKQDPKKYGSTPGTETLIQSRPSELGVTARSAAAQLKSSSNASVSPSLASAASGPTAGDEEKRFFKSLKDLRDFSAELKHKIPIGIYEFEFLEENYPEMPLGKWEWVATRNGVRIYKQIVAVKGSDLVMVKGYVTLDHISPENVLYNIRDTARRAQWDKTFDGFTLIESGIRGNEVVYNSIKAPWPVTDRDFLQWRRIVIDPSTGVIKILHRSAEHPAKPEDLSGAMIRAESIISAYILRPRPPDSCDLFLLTQTDVRGTIPRFLVNSTAARAPFSWVENLRSACQEIQKKRTPIPKYIPKPLYVNGAPAPVTPFA